MIFAVQEALKPDENDWFTGPEDRPGPLPVDVHVDVGVQPQPTTSHFGEENGSVQPHSPAVEEPAIPDEANLPARASGIPPLTKKQMKQQKRKLQVTSLPESGVAEQSSRAATNQEFVSTPQRKVEQPKAVSPTSSLRSPTAIDEPATASRAPFAMTAGLFTAEVR